MNDLDYKFPGSFCFSERIRRVPLGMESIVLRKQKNKVALRLSYRKKEELCSSWFSVFQSS